MTIQPDIYQSIVSTVQRAGKHHPLIVCGHSFMRHPAYDRLFHAGNMEPVPFHDYEPNPKCDSVLKGLRLFEDQHCDMLISVGGGSPIDVAKSIKAFVGMDASKPCVKQSIVPNRIPHLAIPTTAGTGSEATHFAVIYYEGKKYSVADTSLTPDYVVLDAELLSGLPLYQRKATMFDALCHAIESYWSVKATKTSRAFAGEAIVKFMEAYPSYLANTLSGNQAMLQAAHLAGKAINLTTTTAAHAMSYKMTSLYGIAHGHAVSLCLPHVWQYMLTHMEGLRDGLTTTGVQQSFRDIASFLGFDTPERASRFLIDLTKDLGMDVPALRSTDELNVLAQSVNVQRLSNNPIALDATDLRYIYRTILA